MSDFDFDSDSQRQPRKSSSLPRDNEDASRTRRGRRQAEYNHEETRKCPFCAEMIKRQAIKCRFCGEVLSRRLRGRRRKSGVGTLFQCLGLLLLVVGGIIAVFSYLALQGQKPDMADVLFGNGQLHRRQTNLMTGSFIAVSGLILVLVGRVFLARSATDVLELPRR